MRKVIWSFSTLLYGLVIMALLMSSCDNDKSLKLADIQKIDIPDTDILRYEQALFDINPSEIREGLLGIQDDYSVFLDANLDDTLNLLKVFEFVNDPLFMELYKAVMKVFPDLDELTADLNLGFKYMKHYFPDFIHPNVYTYVSGLDYEEPVKFFDNTLIVALDIYLGSDFPVYDAIGIPRYRSNWMKPESIVVDCFRSLALTYLDNNQPRTILDYMIYEGRQLYFLETVIPEIHDSLLLRYNEYQLRWALENERNIWTFFVENQLLFSTETALLKKFINDAPFTAQFGRQAPGRILWFTGLQIVRDYMAAKPEVELSELMQISNAQEILNASRYKPRNKRVRKL